MLLCACLCPPAIASLVDPRVSAALASAAEEGMIDAVTMQCFDEHRATCTNVEPRLTL